MDNKRRTLNDIITTIFLLNVGTVPNRIMFTLEWNSVVIKYRERDVKVWKHLKVYFKCGWNMSPFDINSVVFHFITDDGH
jgi:hypothetical protein